MYINTIFLTIYPPIHISILRSYHYRLVFIVYCRFEYFLLNFKFHTSIFVSISDHTQHSDQSINISEPIVDSRQTSPSLRHSSNLTSSPNDRNSRHISKSESSPECGPMSADSFGESQTAINLGN